MKNRDLRAGQFGRRSAVVLLAACLLASSAGAEVRTSTQTRIYSVGGSTAASLVSYMRSSPLHGDRGDAVANIRPNYSLAIATRSSGGVCRAGRVTLNVHFTMTLPQARNSSALSSGTRSAWYGFTSFARRHEETHRRIYVECANRFVAKAQRMTAGNCMALQGSIRRLLETDKAACERRQLAFDHADSRRVSGLGLFRMARASSRSR